MKKKLIIGGIIVVAVGAAALFLIPWGEYESKLQKSELSETTDYGNTEKAEEDLPPSLDRLEGTYYVNSKKGDGAEILFHVDGLKNTKGGFDEFEVTFEVPDDFKTSQLDVIIQTKSINTGNTMRDKHLREADFFHIEQYPTTEYHASQIVLGDTSYLAKGELTLNGKTKALDLPFKHLGSGGEGENAFEAFEGVFEFDRTQYGQEGFSGVGDVIRLSFYCELKKQ
ncbi:MAG: YceI family protein [Crocinitomicaceae bacterium]